MFFGVWVGVKLPLVGLFIEEPNVKSCLDLLGLVIFLMIWFWFGLFKQIILMFVGLLVDGDTTFFRFDMYKQVIPWFEGLDLKRNLSPQPSAKALPQKP